MSQIALVLFNQLVTMAIYLAIGYMIIKWKMFTAESAKHLTNLLIYIITPMLTLSCFNLEYTKESSRLFLLSFGFSAAMYIASIFISLAARLKGDPEVVPTERFGIIFGNTGFIGTPLTIHLLGITGGFYNIAINAAMNSVMFSYGRLMLGLNQGKRTVKDYLKLFNHPFFYALGIGLFMYFTNLHFPVIIQNVVDSIGNMTSPIAMMCSGMYLAMGHPLKGFKNPRVYFLCLFRLIIIPFIVLGILKLAHLEHTLSLALLVAACTSMASMTIFLSNSTEKRLQRSMEFFVVSVILCIITMPLIVGFASTIL